MVARRGYAVTSGFAIVLMGMFLLGASGADARAFKTGSSFGFYAGTPGSSYPSSFHGQVSSPRKQCRNRRLVKVFRKKPRRNVLVGRTRTSSTGQWTIVENRRVPVARYFAHVPRKKFGARGRHTCRAYKSSALRFGAP